jgi:hypothetical protein
MNYDANNKFAQASRTIAIGLLASGIPIRAGDRVLWEAWEINHVPVETVLRTMDGFTLCGPGARPPEPQVSDTAETPVVGSPDMSPRDWLAALLAGGPVMMNVLFVQARKAGRSPKSLRKAQKALNVLAFQKNRAWYWRLPEAGAAGEPPGRGVQYCGSPRRWSHSRAGRPSAIRVTIGYSQRPFRPRSVIFRDFP